ncbi:MAG: integrase [Verrucomicrobia bacterium]|nr:MAG: integrase [Verrucomicrobiota bacterium]
MSKSQTHSTKTVVKTGSEGLVAPSTIFEHSKVAPGTEDLSGRRGSNRSLGPRQIAADIDSDAISAWLARYSDNAHTFASNRREAERLLLWSLTEAGKPLSSLTHEDLLRYQHFLVQPAERWIMDRGRKWPRHHPRWRPFVGPLSKNSIRQALVILNCMFSWLVQIGYLRGNPLSFLRRRRARQTVRVVRFLDDELWEYVKTTIQSMPAETARQQATQARVRWIFSLLFLSGMRISEVVAHTMGNFFCRSDKAGQPRWWLDIVGKGNKARLIPATQELMSELSVYRLSVGLPALPLEHEAIPLLLPVAWKVPPQTCGERMDIPAPLSRSAVHIVIKQVFEEAAKRVEAQGENYWAQAQRLRAASAHWLRHTAGSRLAHSVDLRHIRDTLGHASLNTTSLYLHVEEDQRHRAIEAGHRLGWEETSSASFGPKISARPEKPRPIQREEEIRSTYNQSPMF